MKMLHTEAAHRYCNVTMRKTECHFEHQFKHLQQSVCRYSSVFMCTHTRDGVQVKQCKARRAVEIC